MDFQRINNAFEYAAIMHKGQHYKYNPDHFQMAHVSFVGAVLLGFGFPEDVMIAGILHDVVEDTQAEISDVEKKFGKKVAELVEAETIDQSLPWEQRQHQMQDRARQAYPEAKAIKTADLLHQMLIMVDPTHQTSQKNYFNSHQPVKVFWKYDELLKALGENWSHPLLDEAKRMLKRMKEKHLDKS